MARGLLFGASFFFGGSLVMIIMILWPESLWGTWLMEKTELGNDFCWFGEGIWRTNMVWGESSRELRCPTHGLRNADALDAYCLNDDYTPGLFDDHNAMCQTATWGRFLMAFGAVLSFLGAWLVIAVHFTTSLKTRSLRLKRALSVMSLSFISYTCLFGSMAGSPMFGTHHFQYLGKRNRVQYKGLGCVFQSPFVRGLASLLRSSPLKCLYPGPAFVLTIGIVLFQLMGCIFLLLLLLDTWKRIATTDALDKRSTSLDPVYSLHGAFMRGLSGFHRLEQNAIGILFPAFVISNALLLVAWFYHGMQFLVHIRVHNQPKPGSDPLIPLPIVTFVELHEQVFTFDPVTTLKDFWEAEAFLLTVVTAFWLDFFPFLKVFMWLFYWFVPQSEVSRGRVLTWLDYLGKWTLANLFCLTIITSGFLFQSKQILPIPLPDKQAIALEVECVVQGGPGVTWFIMSLLWTIALGDIFLQAHTVARTWEIERRNQESTSITPGNIASAPVIPEEGLLDQSTPLLTDARCSYALEENSPVTRVIETTDSDPPSAPSSQPPSRGQSPSNPPSQPRSLFREIVRRTNARFSMATSPNDRKVALCYSAFGPVPNQRQRFSKKGVFLIWFALAFLSVLTLVALCVPFMHVDRSGAVPALLLNEEKSNFSVSNLIYKVIDGGGSEHPAYELGLAFVLFSFVFPLVHCIALMVLWGAPMTVPRQRLAFRFVEFCEAWNALDVFFAAAFIVWVGLESISRNVVEIVVPGLTSASRKLLGMDDVYLVVPTLLDGFWCLLVAVIGQKLISHVLMELTAATIAQRQYVLDHTEVISTPSGENQVFVVNDNQMLTTEQLLHFSPANRYVGVTGTQTAQVIYAGLPKSFWRGGVVLGLMVVEED